jgi:hypothetical protein
LRRYVICPLQTADGLLLYDTASFVYLFEKVKNEAEVVQVKAEIENTKRNNDGDWSL